MESPETEDRWYVNVGGTPKMMNLDEIVEAFEAGTINGKTLVTEVGGTEWKSLKEVADLGDDEEPSAQVPAAAAPVAAAPVPVVKSSAPPSIRATQSGWPPVVAASRPPMSVAPAGTASASPSIAPSAPSPSMAPLSTMPVVQDLGLSLDAEFKPRKSKAPIIAAGFVALFIGGVFGIGRLTGGGEVSRPIPVPAAAPPVAANAPTSNSLATSTPTPAPAPTTTSDSSSSGSSSSDKPSSDKPSSDTGSTDTRLSDEVKAKLKDADKSHAEKKKAAKSARGHAASRSKSSSSSSGVFRAGGNANDPLNSKL